MCTPTFGRLCVMSLKINTQRFQFYQSMHSVTSQSQMFTTTAITGKITKQAPLTNTEDRISKST